MSLNLRSRVQALMARQIPGRMIVVMPGDGPPARDLPDGRGLVLHTPRGFEANPMDGLTEAQRALLGEHDHVVIVRYRDRGLDDGDSEGDTPDGEPDGDRIATEQKTTNF